MWTNLDFPTLSTERLILRKIKPSDIKRVHEGLSDERVTKYYAVSFPTLEATKEQMIWFDKLFDEKTGIWWAICEKDNPQMIGTIGLYEYEKEHRKAEVGYWLIHPSWGNGYASEAVETVVEFGFENMDLNRIEAFVEGGNIASERILKKMGFSEEGMFRQREWKRDKFIDLKIFGVLANERK